MSVFKALLMQPFLKYLILAFSMTLMMQGCFTGVESTPKITASDVRREKVTVTPEMEFFADVRPEAFGSWQPGKAFLVTDDKIGLVINSRRNAAGVHIAAGDTIVWTKRLGAVSVTGDSVTDLVFTRKGGSDAFSYRVNAKASSLVGRADAVEIPFTVDLAVVGIADSKLAGRDLYILTSLWYDLTGNAVDGRRFVRVKADRVEPGNNVYPLKVIFTDEDNRSYCAFLSLAGAGNSTMRNFSTVFSLSDPRKRYPAVTDENWALIQRGEVASGMTRDECRLALGAPNEIDRRPATSGVVEFWSYDNGQYLIFQDGLLTNFRR